MAQNTFPKVCRKKFFVQHKVPRAHFPARSAGKFFLTPFWPGAQRVRTPLNALWLPILLGAVFRPLHCTYSDPPPLPLRSSPSEEARLGEGMEEGKGEGLVHDNLYLPGLPETIRDGGWGQDPKVRGHDPIGHAVDNAD